MGQNGSQPVFNREETNRTWRLSFITHTSYLDCYESFISMGSFLFTLYKMEYKLNMVRILVVVATIAFQCSSLICMRLIRLQTFQYHRPCELSCLSLTPDYYDINLLHWFIGNCLRVVVYKLQTYTSGNSTKYLKLQAMQLVFHQLINYVPKHNLHYINCMKKKRRKQEKMFWMTRRNQNGCIFAPSKLILACIVGDYLCEAWQKPRHGNVSKI